MPSTIQPVAIERRVDVPEVPIVPHVLRVDIVLIVIRAVVVEFVQRLQNKHPKEKRKGGEVNLKVIGITELNKSHAQPSCNTKTSK